MNRDQQLIYAVEQSDTDLLKATLTSKTVDTVNAENQTLLMIATYANNITVAKILVALGADVNRQDRLLNSPFLYAGAAGYLQLVKLYIEHGARFDVFNRYNGTALIPAAEKGHVEVVKLLAGVADFPVNHINRLGWTALMEAVILGNGGKVHTEIVRILLDAGADKHIPDNDGITVMEHAVSLGYKSIISLLR